MSTIGETRYVERPQFFDGQRLLASDLQGLEAFNREMRWLHNRSLHQPGIGRGLAVAGRKGAKEVSVQEGYAIDAMGREIVLTRRHVETVPPVVGEGDGTPVYYDLTVSYPSDEDLEQAETREGICLPRGVVRLREEPIFCWVRLERDALGRLKAKDERLTQHIEEGLKIVLARLAVAHCQLDADASVAARLSARPPRQPYVACGESAVEWQIDSSGSTFPILRAEVGTASAGFGNTPCYVARVKGPRPKSVSRGTAVVQVLDLTALVSDAAPDRFTLLVPLLLLVPHGGGTPVLTVAIPTTGTGGALAAGGFSPIDQFSDWHVEWMGIEG
jgi:hypothetical protein